MSLGSTLPLSSLVAQVEQAVMHAQQLASKQFMQDLAQFFEPAPGQDPEPSFPQGRWLPRKITLPLPREARWRGPLAPPQQQLPEWVDVPLIALAPLRSYAVEQLELLTQIQLAWPSSSDTTLEDGADPLVMLPANAIHSADIKVVIHSQEAPHLIERLSHAAEPELNRLRSSVSLTRRSP
jgi:hypothetical protein